MDDIESVANLPLRILGLEKTIEDLKNNLTLIFTQNKHLQKKISLLTDDINQVQDIQYGSGVKFIDLPILPCENMGIHNVPELIQQKSVEKHVLAALASTNIMHNVWTV